MYEKKRGKDKGWKDGRGREGGRRGRRSVTEGA
jgi:hypothetical protein